MELLSTLGIDWKLMTAQLINFVLLIVILSYFVYKPILRLLDERREKIRKSIEDAQAIENQRKEIDKFKTDQMKLVDKETQKFLEEAKKQADQARVQMVATAQKEADAIVTKAKEQLNQERNKLVSELHQSVAVVTVKLAEKILERQFAKADQDRMMETLTKALPSLIR